MPARDKPAKQPRGGTKKMPVIQTGGDKIHHNVAETNRPDSPELEGGAPLPEELTGRASGTNEDLTALFDNESTQHLADGFRGGSSDDPTPSPQADGLVDPKPAGE
ncbi:MAG: hypothetical protein ABI587_06595 [Gemmatimonadales bacterium]